MTVQKSLSILGCGWLGVALARRLIADGYTVLGSTTRRTRFPEILTIGATPVLLDITQPNSEDAFWKSETVVVALPPRVLESLEHLFQVLMETGWKNKQLILLSTTSVFGRDQGTIDEETPPSPDNERGKRALKVETEFLRNFPQTTVIRLGGLVGPGRHPGQFLNGQTDLADGTAPVNLIHRDDAVGIIRLAVEKKLRAEVLHAVSDEHAPRKEFYTDAARALGLTPPQFRDDTSTQPVRKIKNDKVKSLPGFQFKFPLLRSGFGLIEGAMSKFEELDRFGDCYTARYTPGTRTKEAVLLLHGFPAELGNKNVDIAEDLTTSFSVDSYIIHYAGLGKSTGRFSFERAIEDATAYALYLASEHRYKKIHLIGHSWGSYVAINVFEKLNGLRGALALLAPFSHIPSGGDVELLAEYFIEKNPHIFPAEMKSDLAKDLAIVRDKFSPAEIAAKLNIPNDKALVVHAIQDDIIPLSMIQNLVVSFATRPLYMELDSDHRFFSKRDSLLALLREFFGRVLKG